MRKKRMRGKAGETLDGFKERLGLTSMRAFAQKLGYSDASSIQRYFELDEVPLPWALKLSKKLTGKGDPPLTRKEILALAQSQLDEVLAYIKGECSYSVSPEQLLQFEVATRSGDFDVFDKKLDQILKELAIIERRMHDLERAVEALIPGDDLDPIKARRM